METYFVDNHYTLSGCPKMEAALMKKACKRLLHHLVHECDLNVVVREVQRWQDLLLKENPRWRPCEVSLSKNSLVPGRLSLNINFSSLTLIRVEGEF